MRYHIFVLVVSNVQYCFSKLIKQQSCGEVESRGSGIFNVQATSRQC